MEKKPRIIYAIRVSDHVELRATREGLRAIVSKLTTFKRVKKNEWVDDPDDTWDGGYYAKKDSKIPFVLKQTFFVGGSVVGYLTIYKFTRLFKRTVPRDKPVKMTPLESTAILSAVWRKKHL